MRHLILVLLRGGSEREVLLFEVIDGFARANGDLNNGDAGRKSDKSSERGGDCGHAGEHGFEGAGKAQAELLREQADGIERGGGVAGDLLRSLAPAHGHAAHPLGGGGQLVRRNVRFDAERLERAGGGVQGGDALGVVDADDDFDDVGH